MIIKFDQNPTKEKLLQKYINEGKYYQQIGRRRVDQVKFPRRSNAPWYNVSECDLSHHPMDAVTYWNTTGYLFGPRAREVRAWMSNIDNYIFEPASINRSRGARHGENYRLPTKI